MQSLSRQLRRDQAVANFNPVTGEFTGVTYRRGSQRRWKSIQRKALGTMAALKKEQPAPPKAQKRTPWLKKLIMGDTEI